MSEGPSFQGSTGSSGRTGRRAGVAAIAILAAVAVLIAKPWATEAPGPESSHVASPGAFPGASLPTTAPEQPSPAGADRSPTLNGGFRTPLPPSVAAPWTGLRWRPVSHDPLGLVTKTLRWQGGFIALGRIGGGSPSTPVWTSKDGASWQLVTFNTSSTFWPGTQVLDVVEVPSGLVAITELAYDCAGSPCTPAYQPPAIAWTSPDGLSWTPHEALAADLLASAPTSVPLIAAGLAGLIAATSGPAARVAASTDGATWRQEAPNTLPERFWLDDLAATGAGYVAVGRWMADGARPEAASLWSADGRRWPRSPTLLPTEPHSGTVADSAATSLEPARDGLVAVGRGVDSPGASLWWQSTDGRRWQSVPTLGPLAPAACPGEGCGLQPTGGLASDGRHLLAARGGPDAGAWESFDGQSWRPLEISGDIPNGAAAQASLLPGGVLLTDGANTWYGEALTR